MDILLIYEIAGYIYMGESVVAQSQKSSMIAFRGYLRKNL